METALVARPAYMTPMVVGGTELVGEEEPWVWAVLIGFAYAAALAWAAYCRHTGGDAVISFVWYKGFTVKCTGRSGGGGW